MVQMLPRVRVLDVLKKEAQKKNEAGVYVNTGEMKNVLVVYPYGQNIKFRPAGCVNMEIDSVRLPDIQPHYGKDCMLEVDVETTKTGSQFYTFINIYKPFVAPGAPSA